MLETFINNCAHVKIILIKSSMLSMVNNVHELCILICHPALIVYVHYCFHICFSHDDKQINANC